MRVGDLPPAAVECLLRHPGLRLSTGYFVHCVQSPMPRVAAGVRILYHDYEIEGEDQFVDFHVRVAPAGGLPRWLGRAAAFYWDGKRAFAPFPPHHDYAMLEWGLNWCVANAGNQFLLLHAAVVARDNRAVVLPGSPGAGKSTLCAALVTRGWRLLTDDTALVRLSDGHVVPMVRPMSLKNSSIDLIRRFAPEATVGPETHDTGKGTVAYVRPPAESVGGRTVTARPEWVIFPRYAPGASARLTPLSRGQAFVRLASHSFNYSLLGAAGFTSLGRLVGPCDCYEFSYSRLGDAVETFASLSERLS